MLRATGLFHVTTKICSAKRPEGRAARGMPGNSTSGNDEPCAHGKQSPNQVLTHTARGCLWWPCGGLALPCVYGPSHATSSELSFDSPLGEERSKQADNKLYKGLPLPCIMVTSMTPFCKIELATDL